MKATIYTIIEDKEKGTFEAIISGPWDGDAEMVQVGEKWRCTRKQNALYHSNYTEMFPSEGHIKYYTDDDSWEVYQACFWLSNENRSEDLIDEILHQYYTELVSEACEQRDYYMDRIKKLNAMWKATVDEHDKR